MRKILVLGASPDPWRKSYQAIGRLQHKDFEVIAVGRSHEKVFGLPIHQDIPNEDKLDTILLYINPNHQPQYYNQIIRLKPRYLIFNPGTANAELEEIASAAGIQVKHACALYLIQSNNL